jgi:uncharacterized protein YndB with AHSA1/START domain
VATLNVLINRSAEQVWQVLSDGWRYADWVVGTGAIDDVDAAWPAVGSSLGYRVGAGPLTFRNRTVVRIAEPQRRLELEAHAPPIGSARIAIEILRWTDRSAVVMIDEHPLSGPSYRVHGLLVEAALRLRNGRMMRNLARVVESRTPEPGSEPEGQSTRAP